MIGHRQTGLSMIEILVAMFVLGIGFAGVLSMEAYAIRTNHEAYNRTQAIMQAREIADRMHANLEGYSAGTYSSGMPGSAPTQDCSKGKACTPAQLATQDKWEWNKHISAVLPSGTGTIETNGTRAKVTLTWQEKSESGNVNRSFIFYYKPLPLNLL